jgi:hypothetical protein
MPKHLFPAHVTALFKKRPVTNVERQAVMQAAHRTRKALGISMSDAMKQAWKELRRHQDCRWPTDSLIMNHERTVPLRRSQIGARRLFTRESGRLAGSFIG